MSANCYIAQIYESSYLAMTHAWPAVHMTPEYLILRYIVAQMTSKNDGPLSLGPIPSGRLKNLKDVDKWSSLSFYLPVRGMSVTCELGL